MPSAIPAKRSGISSSGSSPRGTASTWTPLAGWLAALVARSRPQDHRLRKAGAVPHIERVLGDANADVRKCAAEALGEIGGREALTLLVQLQKDPNPYVRAAAEEGLRKATEVRFI